MSRTVMRKVGLVAIFAILGAALPSFTNAILAAEAPQRPRGITDGTDCLLIPGTDPAGAPRVLGGRQALREEYGEGDELFIGGPGLGGLTPGQRLQFVRSYGKVNHPDSNVPIADAIGLLGFAEVLEVNAERAIVLVTKSCREIEVGEYLVDPISYDVPQMADVPDFDPSLLITPNDADATIILGELESVISESGDSRLSTTAREAYSQRDVVVMDQGSSSGWAAGDVVTMYRAKLALELQMSVATYTPMSLGVGMIVAVGDDAAALLIVDGDFAVQIGDRVRRIGGTDS